MAEFTIPRDDWKAFVELFLLEPEKKRVFLDVIKDPLNVFHADDFAKHLTKITGLDHKEADKIIWVLIKLYNLYDASGENIESNLTNIIEAFKEIDEKEIREASITDINLFKEFLNDVLSLHETLGIRAKAYRLMPQHQHIFYKSQIYSDIRAIFKPEDVESKPLGSVIVHSLKLIYYDNYEGKAFYISLSHNDLFQLKNSIERAIKKHQTLKNMIGSFDIQCLEDEG
jgi:hypothetical protein